MLRPHGHGLGAAQRPHVVQRPQRSQRVTSINPPLERRLTGIDCDRGPESLVVALIVIDDSRVFRLSEIGYRTRLDRSDDAGDAAR
jgi:hypothetical protein